MIGRKGRRVFTLNFQGDLLRNPWSQHGFWFLFSSYFHRFWRTFKRGARVGSPSSYASAYNLVHKNVLALLFQSFQNILLKIHAWQVMNQYSSLMSLSKSLLFFALHITVTLPMNTKRYSRLIYISTWWLIFSSSAVLVLSTLWKSKISS